MDYLSTFHPELSENIAELEISFIKNVLKLKSDETREDKVNLLEEMLGIQESIIKEQEEQIKLLKTTLKKFENVPFDLVVR